MKSLLKKAAWHFSLIVLFLPVAASAVKCNSNTGTQLCDPLGITSVSQFMVLIAKAFVLVSLPIVAFFVVLSGFYFITARGNPEKLALAKWNFVYVIIGATLILGAWVFSSLIYATVTSISS